MTKNLINWNSPNNNAYFMLETFVVQTIIDINTCMFALKIIMGLVLKAVKNNENNIHWQMVLIE